MYEGLEHIIKKMEYSMNLTRLLLRDNWKKDDDFQSFRQVVATEIQSLYMKMLKYEMHCVKACDTYWTVVRSFVSWDGWEDEVKSIKTSEAEVDGSMTKYNSEAVREYLRNATAHLGNIETELVALRKSHQEQAQRTMTMEHNQLIGKFSVAEIANKKPVDLNKQRIPNTCEWFRTDPRYEEWLQCDNIFLLLVSAPPGSGKSILSAYLIEEELPLQWPDEQICYYFFNSQKERKKVTNAMRALIHQLLKAYPEIVSSIESDVTTGGIPLMDDSSELGNLFKKATAVPVAGQVICVLDALDECELDGLASLIDCIRSFSPSGTSPNVKFLVTTQGFPHILKKFENFKETYRHISTEEKTLNEVLQGEIKVVMNKRFLEFSKEVKLDQQPRKRDSLWKTMEEASRGQRTYFWIRLVFEALYMSLKTDDAWEDIIKSPPQTIFSAYDKLFRFVKPQDEPRVRIFLHLVFAANSTRPLSVTEANMAVAIHLSKKNSFKTEKDLDKEMMTPEDFRDWIINSCGFFVSISDDQLFFIHQTAKNYLDPLDPSQEEAVEESTDNTQDAAAPKTAHSFRGSVSKRAANAVAAECCVAYMSINKYATFDRDVLFDYGVIRDHPSDNGIFLDYAMTNWIAHFQAAQEFQGEGEKAVIVDIDDRFSSRYFALWEPVKGDLKTVLERSLWGTKTSFPDWSYEPLSASVAAGQGKLLARRLTVDTADRNAIFSKRYPNRKDDSNRLEFPLSHIACHHEYTQLLRFILDQGADVDAFAYLHGFLHSLLHAAVETKNLDIINLVLDRGAKVDQRKGREGGEGRQGVSLGDTPLVQDLRSKMNPATIRALVDHGASWDISLNILHGSVPDQKFRITLMELCLAGFDSSPGFAEAVSAIGIDLEEIRNEAETLEKRRQDNPRNRYFLRVNVDPPKEDKASSSLSGK
jgi:NWD NACHT NTPase-like protein